MPYRTWLPSAAWTVRCLALTPIFLLSFLASKPGKAIDPTENWSLVLTTTNPITRVRTAGDRVFALGVSSIYESTNGQNWTRHLARATPTDPDFLANGVAVGQGKYVLVGNRRILVSTSTHLDEWTAAVFPDEVNGLNDVQYIGEHFLAVGGSSGYGGHILASPDGLTWTPQSSGVLSELQCIAVGAGRVVVVGGGHTIGGISGGVVLSSTNGATWQTHEIPSLAGQRFLLHAVVYHQGRFVATGFGAREETLVVSSVDGTNWGASIQYPHTAGLDVTAGSGHFLAVGAVETSSSPDGIISWFRHPTPGVRSVAHFAETFVGVEIASAFSKYQIWRTSSLRPRFVALAPVVGSPQTLRAEIEAVTGSALELETSVDLSHWTPSVTVPGTGSDSTVLVKIPPGQPRGFWRVRTP